MTRLMTQSTLFYVYHQVISLLKLVRNQLGKCRINDGASGGGVTLDIHQEQVWLFVNVENHE